MRTVGYAPLVSVRRRFDCIVDQLHIFLRDFKTSGTCERAKIYDTQRGGWGGGGGHGEVEKALINSPKQMKLYLVSGNSSVSVNLRS